MSLDSLNALKQLTQVRQESASIQNDNLEKVQSAVEQTSVSEASRVDGLNLEKIKTEYEVALSKARVDRLQSQLERQEKAVVFQSIGLLVSGGLALGDTLFNLAKDLKGGQQLGDGNQDNKIGDQSLKGGEFLVDKKDGSSAADFYSTGESKKLNLFVDNGSKGRQVDIGNASQLGLIQQDDKGGYSLTDAGKAAGLKLKNGNQLDDVGSLAGVKENAGKAGGAKANGDNFSIEAQTVARTSIAGDGSTSSITVGVLSENQVREKAQKIQESLLTGGTLNVPIAQQLGLVGTDGKVTEQGTKAGLKTNDDGSINTDGLKAKLNSGKFSDLFAVDKKSARELYDGNFHDVKKSEVGAVSDALKDGLKGLKVADSTDPKAASDSNTISEELRTKASAGVDDYFKSTGKKESTKAGANLVSALVSFANVVVPQFQALLKAKDDVANTEEELKAAKEKLAAAQKKLKQIEAIIVNAGSAGDPGQSIGNAN